MFSSFLKKNGDGPLFEEKRYFETDEEKFFGRLNRALPNCYIFPQVEVSRLLEPVANNEKKKAAVLKLLEGRKADYAVFDASMGLLCVIELTFQVSADGQSTSNVDYFKSAGIKTIRWDRNNLPNFEQILRIMAPFSTLSAPKTDVASSTIMRSQPFENTRAPDTVAAIYAADPIPSNIVGVPMQTIEKITPNKYIQRAYPHIWQRICLFLNEPKHLQKYLISLSIQDRGVEREGFPLEVLKEIADIQIENDRYLKLAEPRTAWQTGFINR